MHVNELVVLRSQINHGMHGMFAEFAALFEVGDTAHAVGAHLEAFLHEISARFAVWSIG